MRFLVFQHAAVEHPGVLRDFLRADCIPWDAIELDQGAAIPPLEGYDALMVLGGPMDVWQEDRHPWLALEKVAIRQWVNERRAPFLGVCLGHQLLADALGGKVGLMSEPEIGVLEVKLTDAGRSAPLFEGMPAAFPVLQWHSAEVSELPRHAVKLAESGQCAIQAFQIGEKAYGIQYLSSRTSAQYRNGAKSPSTVARSKSCWERMGKIDWSAPQTSAWRRSALLPGSFTETFGISPLPARAG
jgi:GMP synthase-like glutamine amidotransferase